MDERNSKEQDTMGRAHIEVPKDKLQNFCRQWNIQELSLSGSVLRDLGSPTLPVPWLDPQAGPSSKTALGPEN